VQVSPTVRSPARRHAFASRPAIVVAMDTDRTAGLYWQGGLTELDALPADTATPCPLSPGLSAVAGQIT